MATDSMTVKINPNDKGNPVGRLADAELHFTGGPLEGLKLIGFGIWERRGGSGRNVTFPARQYSVNGECGNGVDRQPERPTRALRSFTDVFTIGLVTADPISTVRKLQVESRILSVCLRLSRLIEVLAGSLR